MFLETKNVFEHDSHTCFFAKELTKEDGGGIISSHFQDVKSVGGKATNNEKKQN